MQVDRWSVLSSEKCDELSVVVVTSDETPADLRRGDLCAGTLFDSRMGPRFPGDRCGTCNGSSEVCKLGHFGVIHLRTHVFMIKYVKPVARAMREICQVCWHAAGKECRKGGGKCSAFGKKVRESRKGSTLLIDGVAWSATRVLHDFIMRVPADEWANVPSWGSSSEPPMNCIFDRVLVLPNPHRPSALSKDGSKVSRAHRHTEAYAKLIRVVSKRPANYIPGVTAANDEDVFSAFNDLFLDTRRDHRSTESECAGILSSMTRKEGLIRNNLLGKRVDFSARAVVIGNPDLRVDQFGVPRAWREKLTVPETVWTGNLDAARAIVRGGEWTTIIKASGGLRYDADAIEPGMLASLASRLTVGDVVERWLRNGDPVMFIRQPTLHKGSMMCGRVVLNDLHVIEMNVNSTTPYNGDFDGDEFNAFVPRSVQARVEFEELFALKNQIVNENGQCQVHPIQNAALGIYLATMERPGSIPHVDPHQRGVTSDQAREVVRRVWFDDGPEAAVRAIQDMSVSASNWLDVHGASVGLNEFDCARLDSPRESDGALLREQKKEAARVAANLKSATYDPKLAFGEAAAYMKRSVNPFDPALRRMIASGSKGKSTNELNIALVVGAQSVGDAPPKLFLGDRVLPCDVTRNAPAARRGFIPVGYVEGLRPEHTAVHQMSGRHDIYTKSVGVKESGERFRDLGQCMENLVATATGGVVDAKGSIVQFAFGSDGFDPKTVRPETGTPMRASYPSSLDPMVPTPARMRPYAGDLSPERAVRDFFQGQVAYGQAVGIVAAHSISEPATQETMNKFHHSDDASATKNMKRLFRAWKGEAYVKLVHGNKVPPILTSWERTVTCPPSTPEWCERFERVTGLRFNVLAPAFVVLRLRRETDAVAALKRLRSAGFTDVRASHPALDPGDVVVHVALPTPEASVCDVVHIFHEFSLQGHWKCRPDKCFYDSHVTKLEVVGEEDVRCTTTRFDRLLGSDFIEFRTAYTDDSNAMAGALGIESARAMLYREFTAAFAGKVNSRHVSLLVDAMTYEGSVRGMSFTGFKATSSDSVMGMACFRQPLDGMFRAALEGKIEGNLCNVSASVLTGNLCALGTGTVTLVAAPRPTFVAVDSTIPYAAFLPSFVPAYVVPPSSPPYVPSSPPHSPHYVPSSPPSSPPYAPPSPKRARVEEDVDDLIRDALLAATQQ